MGGKTDTCVGSLDMIGSAIDHSGVGTDDGSSRDHLRIISGLVIGVTRRHKVGHAACAVGVVARSIRVQSDAGEASSRLVNSGRDVGMVRHVLVHTVCRLAV